jgi:glycosyltransferase involved in cell wall biosynthesis
MSRMIMLSNVLFYRKKTIMEVTLDGDDDPVSLMSKGIRNKLFKHLTKFLLRRIDKFIVPSKGALDSCLKTGISNDRIWLMPHPVDEAIFASISFNEKQRLRKKLGLPDKFIMMNVGMLYPRKNQLFLIKCLKELGKDDAILLLIGPEHEESRDYLKKIKNYISDNGLEDNVRLLGVKKNVNEYLIASDVLVFASSSEGFPNIIAESLVSGLPTLTLELDCLDSFLDNQAGLSIIRRDNKSENDLRKEFVERIKFIYSQRGKSSRNKIRKEALKLFSSTLLDAEYYKLYKKILNEQH